MASTTPLTVQYKEANGSNITTDIYLPPGEPTSYPVLINIHGGAFMLGHSRMVSMPQIDDCLARNWIVVVPNHRLCPQVNILDGPISDCRDLLQWIYAGQLDAYLQSQNKPHRVDHQRVMAFGTSSGGTLALSLGYDVPNPPAAILNFYGAVHFTHPFWTSPLPHVKSKLPPFEDSFLQQIYAEYPVPTSSAISLEGQSETPSGAGPDFTRPRDAFAFTQIANGTVLAACFPGRDVREIDPVAQVGPSFPPTFIVHGMEDRMVPIHLSRRLLEVLRGCGVRCGMVEVPGEDHTFAMGMTVGSRTWQVQRQGFDFLEEVISSHR
ncbi:alpha/beta-hydrolase [Aspergillus floccosus]